MLAPYYASAAQIYTDDSVTLSAPLAENVYIAWGQISTSNTLTGDLVAWGGMIDIHSEVHGDLLIGGWQISITWPVKGDVRVTGGSITISSLIDGDCVVTGGNVILTAGAQIRGDLIVWAGTMVLNGVVEKNARIGVGELTFGGKINGNTQLAVGEFRNPSGSGSIGGNLAYTADHTLPELERLTQGEKTFTQMDTPEVNKKAFLGLITGYVLLKILGIFIFSVILIFGFPKFWRETAVILEKHPWKSLLTGLILLVLVPVVAIILMITVIGIPVGLFSLVFYAFMLWLCNLINVSVLSTWIYEIFSVKPLYQKLLVALGWSILFGIVPILGFIVWLFTVGATITRKGQILQNLR